MKNRAASFLHDIATACEAALEFTRDKTLAEYEGSLILRSAVERQLTIVGEAATQLRALDPAIAGALGDVRAIAAFRNLLIHGYFKVDNAIVWLIVTNDLPALLVSARHALAQAGGPGD